MDDPWGSPWAVTDTPTTSDVPKQSEPDNSFLSPPPRAFFGSVSSPSPTQSPWANAADDDEFGGWSTADRPEASNGQTAWGLWPDSNSQLSRLSPRLSVSSKDSALAWPNNTVPSPALKSRSGSRTPSIFRQYSPDPWAAQFSLNNNTESDLPSPLTSIIDPIPKVDVPPVDEPLAFASSSAGHQISRIEEDSGTQAPNSELNTDHDEITRAGANATETVDIITGNTQIRPNPAINTPEPPSRSSSLLSEDSHSALEGQESPITSIDEERGFRLQDASRKSSGKVQGLVGVYDQLSRAASEAPPVVETPGRSTSRRRSDVEEGNQFEYGGLESAEDAVTRAARASLDAAVSPNSSSTLEAPLNGSPGRAQHYETENPVAPVSKPRVPSAQIRGIFKKYGDINFNPDLGLLDNLFPQSATLSDDGNGEHLEVSDHIIRDNFGSISERKAWYRISRYGSMRQHNSGDIATYRRVTWKTSNLHDEVVKIARRWMEEDAYAGRAVLGGTKRTGFFDWDSEAAPVSLEEVFRRKEAPNHARTTSIPANPVVARAASLDRPYRNSTGISLAEKPHVPVESAAPTLNFGWNLGNDLNPMRPDSRSSIPPPASVSRPSPVQTTVADEDEDDWGEMVSSPIAAEDPRPTYIQQSANGRTPEPKYSEHVAQVLTGPTSPNPERGEAKLALAGVESLIRDGPSTINESPPAASSSLSDDIWQLGDGAVSKAEHFATTQTVSVEVTRTQDPLSMPETTQDTSAKDYLTKTSSALTTAARHTTKETTNDAQDAAIVEDILKSLPDFSYMLR
ncbi:hypothetical protein F5Y18DRAFT_360836 [Xylariaceae sp. FL1019]|nr:hypothetical protein F5Y18DRAFT_360836 [Xylariaceae sp. FL1019]